MIFGTIPLFKCPKSCDQPGKMEFKFASLWIKFFNLPIGCMNEGMLIELGKMIREVEDVEPHMNEDA